MDLVVTITVGGENAAVLGNGHAGRHVEGRIQGRAVGRHRHHGPAAAAQFEQLLTVLRVLGDDVLLPVGDPHMVLSVDKDAVRLGEFTLTPGGDKFSGISLKRHHRVLVAAEDKDSVARIDRHVGHRTQQPSFWHLRPGIVKFIAKIAISNCHNLLSSDVARSRGAQR